MNRGIPAHLREIEPWVRRLGRFGYISKGVVYVVVAILALRAALSRGRPGGSEEALGTVVEQPFGRAALGAVAVGLAGYVIWRLVQVIRDPGRHRDRASGIALRIGYGISALIHAALAVEAARLLLGASRTAGATSSGGDASAVHWTAIVLEQSAGRWVIAAVGAGTIVFGLYELYRAATADFVERYHLLALPLEARTTFVRSGRLGLGARGIVLGVIGLFLIRAAVQFDPTEARGLGGALQALRAQPYGPYLLGSIAAGLLAYGVFQAIKGRYGVLE